MAGETSTSPSDARSSADSARRRSSAGLFSQISQQKRGPENTAFAARRQSIEEQTSQKPGFIASAFNNVFKGPSASNNAK